MKKYLRIQNHQVTRKKESNDKLVAPIYGKTEYLNNLSIQRGRPMHKILSVNQNHQNKRK